MTLKRSVYLLGFGLLFVIAPAGYQIDRIAAALPVLDGEIRLPGLAAPAEVQSDRLAIPSVEARTREDAYRILGFLHARDRLFQMDLMRRKSAGRLAEIFGEPALPVDRRQRVYRFQEAAERIVASLPVDQQAILKAYTGGINAYIGTARERPFEFRVLRYRPEAWKPADSFLVALGMFQTLTDQEWEERMLTVMDRLLPPEVTAFLTPDTDEYASVLLGGHESRRPARPIPVASIAKLTGETDGQEVSRAAVAPEPLSLGSNNWAVNGSKTADGRAMIANDMHLPLAMPNLWYRARLRYAGLELSGITLPGVPLPVVGSNGRVAWGYTNVDGDFLDLVRLEINPADPNEYRTPNGWRRFDTRTETIAVKDGRPADVELRSTLWGPVSPEPLLGEPVAIRWTALDTQAVNLGLTDMDGAATLEQAMAVLNRAGAPPQNVVLADTQGRIAWTYLGFFPRRTGFDGSVSVSWAEGRAGWDRFIPPDELPRVIDPPEGFLATANNRTLGKNYPYVIGHGFSHGYRAYRIAEWLRAKDKLTEKDLLDLQLDTVSGFYEFYRELALAVLGGDPTRTDPDLADAERAIRRWNGRMDPDSLGIGLLVRWRQDLLRAIFAPLVSRCAAAEPGFAYFWGERETPLRALLRAQIPATLPDRRYADWRTLLADTLRHSIIALKEASAADRLEDLAWGRLNEVKIQHPFSRAFPATGWFLDMPEIAGGCNGFCIKVLHDTHGAGERMVISPNHPEDGLLHMPGGQSGHPFSPHYRDQQKAWAEGAPLPFLSGKVEHRLSFVPG